MPQAGRNDPCPCNSGRKYKDCCLARHELRPAGAVSPATRESALTKLLTFAFSPAFDSDHSVAEAIFWGDLLKDAARFDVQRLLDSEEGAFKYNSWFLFDWEVEDEGTVADLFLEEQHADLTAAERRFLAGLTRAPLRLYEVEQVHRGEGMTLRDVWSGDCVRVSERTASRQIVTWDLLAARATPDGAGGRVFEGGLYLYPASMKGEIVGHFRRLYRRFLRKAPDGDSNAFFRRHGMVFNHLWLKLVAYPDPPAVVTSDGEPLIFCRVVFDAADADGVQRLVAGRDGVQPVDGSLVWEEAGPGGPRELGRWSVDDGRVVFETTSQSRAARGRAWLEAFAGDLVRYRATALEPVEHTMAELRRRQSLPAAPPPAGESDPVRDLYDRHYRLWLDRPHVDLGGRTPRRAAGTKLWRARLIDVLKQAENSAERDALQGRPSYDFSWIWDELGLDRPRLSS